MFKVIVIGVGVGLIVVVAALLVSAAVCWMARKLGE